MFIIGYLLFFYRVLIVIDFHGVDFLFIFTEFFLKIKIFHEKNSLFLILINYYYFLNKKYIYIEY